MIIFAFALNLNWKIRIGVKKSHSLQLKEHNHFPATANTARLTKHRIHHCSESLDRSNG